MQVAVWWRLVGGGADDGAAGLRRCRRCYCRALAVRPRTAVKLHPWSVRSTAHSPVRLEVKGSNLSFSGAAAHMGRAYGRVHAALVSARRCPDFDPHCPSGPLLRCAGLHGVWLWARGHGGACWQVPLPPPGWPCCGCTTPAPHASSSESRSGGSGSRAPAAGTARRGQQGLLLAAPSAICATWYPRALRRPWHAS